MTTEDQARLARIASLERARIAAWIEKVSTNGVNDVLLLMRSEGRSSRSDYPSALRAYRESADVDDRPRTLQLRPADRN